MPDHDCDGFIRDAEEKRLAEQAKGPESVRGILKGLLAPPPIQPEFAMQEMVGHVAEPGQKGMIVAFMVRGKNHSYQVQWGISKLEWHLDFELVSLPVETPSIGFVGGDS